MSNPYIEFNSSWTFKEILDRAGVEYRKGAKGCLLISCPFHQEKTPSCSLVEAKGRFRCFGCNEGGDKLDLARALIPSDVEDFFSKRNGKEKNRHEAPVSDGASKLEEFNKRGSSSRRKDFPWHLYDKVESYRYMVGDRVCAVRTRYKLNYGRAEEEGFSTTSLRGKQFTMKFADDNDHGPFFYRHDEVLNAENKYVFFVEGEKDVETLRRIGFIATTVAGVIDKKSAGIFKGKHVIFCGDRDPAGEKYKERFLDVIEGNCDLLSVYDVPRGKDISDYVQFLSSDEGKSESDIKKIIEEGVACCRIHERGVSGPVHSMRELERIYKIGLRSEDSVTHGSRLQVGEIFKSLSGVRSLKPGDLFSLLGYTAVGKTSLLQHIAVKSGMITVFFQLELGLSDMFEGGVASVSKGIDRSEVERVCRGGGSPDYRGAENVYYCDESGISIDRISSVLEDAEKKAGERPRLVIVDYIGLMDHKGIGVYETVSKNAKGLKNLAKSYGCVVGVSSQVTFPKEEEAPHYRRIKLSDSRDSKDIGNSSQLAISLRRSRDSIPLGDIGRGIIEVLKSSRGGGGLTADVVLGMGMTFREYGKSMGGG